MHDWIGTLFPQFRLLHARGGDVMCHISSAKHGRLMATTKAMMMGQILGRWIVGPQVPNRCQIRKPREGGGSRI